MGEKMRLSKLMAQRGLCSRREADALIEKGLVEVDGKVVSQLGSKVDEGVKIRLKPKGKNELQKKVTILLYKPVGYASHATDEGYKVAADLIKSSNQDPSQKRTPLLPSHKKGLAPAGRLDIDSKGLIVLTQDGTVAKLLIGHESPVEKEYLVDVKGKITTEKIEKLTYGLELDGKKLKPAKVKALSESHFMIILNEGKKRQIRRMCELVDLKVTGLKRTRIGKINLGNLKEGQWRFLKPNESFY